MNAKKTLVATQFKILPTLQRKKVLITILLATNNKINIAIFKLGVKRKQAGNSNE